MYMLVLRRLIGLLLLLSRGPRCRGEGGVLVEEREEIENRERWKLGCEYQERDREEEEEEWTGERERLVRVVSLRDHIWRRKRRGGRRRRVWGL